MKTQFINHKIFVLTLVIVLIVFGRQEMSYGQDLNVGEPRTVRMIYFLPNDLPYRADVVQNMKDMIRTVQKFYAEQMEVHGYGNKTFQYETDDQGHPMVHRVDGQHPFSHYDNTLGTAVIKELEQAYDLEANIYFIVLGAEALRQGNGSPIRGVASQLGKNGGHLVVPNEFSRFTVGHELGHTFGLIHDFRDNSYIMSYGNRQNSSLSACAAEFLAVSPHLNPRIPIAETSPPTIELISSPTYPAGSKSIPVRLKIKDSDGIHQVQLHARGELQECRGLAGKQEAVVEFEYDGGTGLSDATVHNILIKTTDADGNAGTAIFKLAAISPYHSNSLEEHTDRVVSVAFSSDRKTLASGSWDNAVKLWDATTKENIDTFKHTRLVKSVAFSPNGRILASGGDDGIVTLWDVTTREEITTLKHGDFINSLSFSRNGTMLASGGDDWTIKLWNMATKKNIATLRHGYYVQSVSFSPDGTMLVSCAWDGTIKLWDVQAETEIETIREPEGIHAVLFSPTGKTFISASFQGTIKFWNVETQTEITTFNSQGVYPSVAFSPDGAILATGTLSGSIVFWDVESQIELTTIGYPGGITSLAFSYDGATLATGTQFGTVELWDVPLSLLEDKDVVVSIPDPNLASEVRKNLGVPLGVAITRSDMRKLKVAHFIKGQITDLTGLEHAINLRDLTLSRQQINNIAPLAGLTNLESLGLSENQINDITPLTGLTDLQSLDISHNPISDISLIAKFTRLKFLDLDGIPIKDTTIFTELTELQHLELINCQLSELGQIARLTKLEHLFLLNNQIIDVSPLTNLLNLRYLFLEGNPIKSREPLLTLLRKNPDVKIILKGNTPLPVTLSHFRAEHTEAGVILNWTTESEVDNAGFYIYRSPTKDGEFKVINSKIIQGAGTTGERNEYTWTDITAKPNTVYYYQIEDVSHAGVREKLATVRLRGLVSAIGKFTTLWADLKAKN